MVIIDNTLLPQILQAGLARPQATAHTVTVQPVFPSTSSASSESFVAIRKLRLK